MSRKYPGGQLPQMLRDEIYRRELSQYRIAQDTGIKQPSLSRFLNGGSLRMETAAMLLEYLGYDLSPRLDKRQRRRK